jgi:hypothetical protein
MKNVNAFRSQGVDKKAVVTRLKPKQYNNLNNVRRKPSRHYENTKKEYLTAKIYEVETCSEITNIRDLYRGISDFKKGCQPRTYIIEDEKSNLVTESHSILARWRNHFSQLWKIH